MHRLDPGWPLVFSRAYRNWETISETSTLGKQAAEMWIICAAQRSIGEQNPTCMSTIFSYASSSTAYTLHWSVGESAGRWAVFRAGVALKLASVLIEKFNQFKQVLVVSQHKNIGGMKALSAHFFCIFKLFVFCNSSLHIIPRFILNLALRFIE